MLPALTLVVLLVWKRWVSFFRPPATADHGNRYDYHHFSNIHHVVWMLIACDEPWNRACDALDVRGGIWCTEWLHARLGGRPPLPTRTPCGLQHSCWNPYLAGYRLFSPLPRYFACIPPQTSNGRQDVSHRWPTSRYFGGTRVCCIYWSHVNRGTKMHSWDRLLQLRAKNHKLASMETMGVIRTIKRSLISFPSPALTGGKTRRGTASMEWKNARTTLCWSYSVENVVKWRLETLWQLFSHA
jgi:hypothetical protein